MPDKAIHDEASEAEAKDNVVHVQGPADVDISLTPRAALATAKHIESAAVDAILAEVNTTKPK